MANELSVSDRIYLGFRRQPWKAVASVPVALALLWAPTEPIVATYTNLTTPYLLGLLFALAVVIAIYRSMLQTHTSISLGATRIEIVVGDVFHAAKNIAISCDDLFLVTHPKLVNKRSLISQLVQSRFQGSAPLLERRLRQELGSLVDVNNTDASTSRRKYPIGTTVVLREAEGHIFVAALCRVDEETNTGSATPEDVLVSLYGVWEKVAQHPTGEAVAVPLFGGGQSGTGLPAPVLLHLALVSLAAFVRKHTISDVVRIVLPPAIAHEFDLTAVRNAWANSGKA